MSEKPRFNHVALSLPPAALDEDGRREICDFYSDVFGWAELPQMTEDRKRLVLMAYEFGQFVFLMGTDQPMQTTTADHFGMSVATMAELDDMLAKAKRRQRADDRVHIEDKSAEDFGPLLLTSFYVRHLLPLTIEVQHFDWRVDVSGTQRS